MLPKTGRYSRRISMSELQSDLHLFYGTLVNIIQDLGFTEMSERWVPRNLKEGSIVLATTFCQ